MKAWGEWYRGFAPMARDADRARRLGAQTHTGEPELPARLRSVTLAWARCRMMTHAEHPVSPQTVLAVCDAMRVPRSDRCAWLDMIAAIDGEARPRVNASPLPTPVAPNG